MDGLKATLSLEMNGKRLSCEIALDEGDMKLSPDDLMEKKAFSICLRTMLENATGFDSMAAIREQARALGLTV